jgi:hypothetical protein
MDDAVETVRLHHSSIVSEATRVRFVHRNLSIARISAYETSDSFDQ